MKVDRFQLYLFLRLKEYQKDLKLSDIVIINDENEKLVKKYQKKDKNMVQEDLAT